VRRWHSFSLVALPLAAAVLLSACSSGPSTSPQTQPVVATYATAGPANGSALASAAEIVTIRLRSLSHGAVAQVIGQQIEILSSKPLSGSVLDSATQYTYMYLRPVLCDAAPFLGSNASGSEPASAPLPTCSPGTQLTAANLNVDTTTGQALNNVPNDTTLDRYPSTSLSSDVANATVLLQGLPGEGTQRYLLGPAGLSSNAVQGANADEDTTGAWSVLVSLTAAGSARWDNFARENFHQYIAIDVNGIVISAPLNQPTQSSFSSFQGAIQVSGGQEFTGSFAQHLAKSLNAGFLPVRLRRI
jgi:hypothetical protein